MSFELFYTSAPRGLKPGAKGFCTVGMTQGLPAVLADRLELLSGYRPLFPAGHASSEQNPVSYAHWRLSVAGRTWSVLSRLCFAGFDYTQRTNKFAHHLVLSPEELAAGGPAWLMQQPEFLQSQWDGEPRWLEAGRAVPRGDRPPGICTTWGTVCGDAGWGGALAQVLAGDLARPSYLIYPVGTDVLSLIGEALSLVPAPSRWNITFNTYFTDLPAGTSCALRCCADGSPAAAEARRLASTSPLVIDLTSSLEPPEDSAWVDAARTGETPSPARAASYPSGLAALEQGWSDPETDGGLIDVDSAADALTGASTAAEEPPDQSWMPPVSTTIVERDPDGNETLDKPRVWPWIVVAGAGWAAALVLFLMRMTTPTETVAVARPTEPSTRSIAAEIAEWQAKYANEHDARRIAEQRWNDAESRAASAEDRANRADARASAAEVKAKDADARASAADARTKNAFVEAQSQHRATTLPTVAVMTPATTTETLAATPRAVNLPPPTETKPVAIYTSPGPKVTGIQLAIVQTEDHGLPVYALVQHGNTWQVTRATGALGQDQMLVATFFARDKQVLLEWAKHIRSDIDPKGMRWLSLHVVLQSGAEQIVQFQKWQTKPSIWSNDSFDVADAVANIRSTDIRLRASFDGAKGSTWKIKSDENVVRISNPIDPLAGFALRYENRNVSSDYQGTIRSIQQSLHDAEASRRQWDDAGRIAESAYNFYDQQHPAASRNEKEQERATALRAERDNAYRKRDAEIAKATNLTQILGQFDQMPRLRLFVDLSNGICLCEIQVGAQQSQP